MYRILLTLTLAALVAGCGLKGPLYLPGDKPAPKQPAKPTPPAPQGDAGNPP